MATYQCPKCQHLVDLEKDSLVAPSNPPWQCSNCGAKLDKNITVYFILKLAVLIGSVSVIASTLTFFFGLSVKLSGYVGLSTAFVVAWWYIRALDKLKEVQ